MTTTTTTGMRELDHRHSDGIDVRLLWDQGDNRVHVAVSDRKTGESFVVEVREGESAANIFQHPFAYADRGVPATPVTRTVVPAATSVIAVALYSWVWPSFLTSTLP